MARKRKHLGVDDITKRLKRASLNSIKRKISNTTIVPSLCVYKKTRLCIPSPSTLHDSCMRSAERARVVAVRSAHTAAMHARRCTSDLWYTTILEQCLDHTIAQHSALQVELTSVVTENKHLRQRTAAMAVRSMMDSVAVSRTSCGCQSDSVPRWVA